MAQPSLDSFVGTATKPSLDSFVAAPQSPSTPAQPTTQGGVSGYNPITDIAGSDTRNAGGFLSGLLQSSIGSKGIAGVAQLPGKAAAAVSEFGPGGQHQSEDLYSTAQKYFDQSTKYAQLARTEADPQKQTLYKTLADNFNQTGKDTLASGNDINQRTGTTGGQAIGTSLNAGLTLATGWDGGGNFAGNIPAVAKLGEGTGMGAKVATQGIKSAENALVGVGFNTASNLENGQAPLQGSGSAAAFGAIVPGLATGLAKGINLARGGSENAGYQLVGSLIKPLDKTFAYGKDPIRGIINEGITANSFDELGQKVSSSLHSIGSQIGDVGKKVTASGVKMNLAPALSPLDVAIENAAKLNNEPLFNSLQRMKTALTNDLGVGATEGTPSIVIKGAKQLNGVDYQQAVNVLSDVRDHTRFTGNPSDDKAINNTAKQIYGGMRDIMNTTAEKADPKLGAAIRDLNTRYADLSSSKLAIDHRDIALKKQNFLSLADKFGYSTTVASALATGAVTGNWAEAGKVLLGGLVGTGLIKASNSTAVATRAAKFLNALGPTEREGILRSTPILRNYYERLTGNKAAN